MASFQIGTGTLVATNDSDPARPAAAGFCRLRRQHRPPKLACSNSNTSSAAGFRAEPQSVATTVASTMVATHERQAFAEYWNSFSPAQPCPVLWIPVTTYLLPSNQKSGPPLSPG